VKKTLMITKDLLNPVGNYLYTNNLVVWDENNFRKDLTLLVNSEILVFGFTTMIFYIVLASQKLKKLYLPRYAYDAYKMKKIDIDLIMRQDQELIIIDLPEYPHHGEFEHTEAMYTKMIEYKPTLITSYDTYDINRHTVNNNIHIYNLKTYYDK
jgi:hypothetical protein